MQTSKMSSTFNINAIRRKLLYMKCEQNSDSSTNNYNDLYE